MPWHRVILRSYHVLGRVAKFIGGPLLRLRLGQETVGRRVDRWMRYLITPVIRAPNPVLVQGHLMWYPSADVFEEDFLALDNHEPETTRLVKELVRPGMTFVDLGAFIGYYTLLAARQVGDAGHVFAFEPAPYAIEVLKRNVGANGYEARVTVIPMAVSNTTGRSRLFLPRLPQGLSSLHPNTLVTSRFVEVETTTLDASFASLGWHRVDLIKMDIEGAEKAALEGMVEVSRRNPDLKLIIEFAPVAMRGAGVRPEEFFAALEAVGFSSYWLIGHQLERLEIPRDIPCLVPMAEKLDTIGKAVNLYCEKAAS